MRRRDVHLALGGARYGGQIARTLLRVYGNYQLNDDFRLANGGRPTIAGTGEGGFRLDHYTRNDGHLTGRETSMRQSRRPYRRPAWPQYAWRWTQRLSERSSYEVQAFFEHTTGTILWRKSPGHRRSDFSAHLWIRRAQRCHLGLGYRFTDSRCVKQHRLTIVDNEIPLHLFSAFVQDELKIIPDRLTFTLARNRA